MARQRRHSYRRRRRGRFGGAYRVLAALGAVAALAVACVVFFRVNEVTVTGNVRYTAQEITEISGIRAGDNLITLPKSRVAGNLIAKLPYIRSVSIRRQLPDGVLITVTEHAAAAAVSDGESWWYIASQGKLLEQVEDTGAVMRVQGLSAVSPLAGQTVQVAQEEQNTLEYVLALLTQLEKRSMLGQCTALDCRAAASITLEYGIYQVKLPRRPDYGQYLALLQAAIDSDKLPQGVPGTFDLTIQEGRAYFLPQEEQEPPAQTDAGGDSGPDPSQTAEN